MPSEPQKKFYLTTPIYYVNARPHIGHAYTTIVADVLARRHRLLGDDVFFLTGTDEHGQKIERSAAAAGIPPQQFADGVSAEFQKLWDRMGLTYNKFIRTTDPAHARGVQKLFTELYNRGFIYLSTYTGAYCVSDEAFVDAPVGTACPDCGRLLEEVTEENFFFKLSAFQAPLINLIETGVLAVEPESRRNEVLSFLRGNVAAATTISPDTGIQPEAKYGNDGTPELAPASSGSLSVGSVNDPSAVENRKGPASAGPTNSHKEESSAGFSPRTAGLDNGGSPAFTSAQPSLAHSDLGTPYVPGALKDLSISRSSFTWGIPVPAEVQQAAGATQNHIIYVWLDALANYMTALGYGSELPDEQKHFQHYWPADLQLVGKEIIRFHCVYWPAFLLAAGLPLPKAITAHGWLLFDNSKMSKSKGNIVRTETILQAFGTLCPPIHEAIESSGSLGSSPDSVNDASATENRKGPVSTGPLSGQQQEVPAGFSPREPGAEEKDASAPDEHALKGTGFSPSVTNGTEEGASAPEGVAATPAPGSPWEGAGGFSPLNTKPQQEGASAPGLPSTPPQSLSPPQDIVPLRLSSRPEAEGRSGETPAFREASAAGTSKSTEGAGGFSPLNTAPKQEGASAPGLPSTPPQSLSPPQDIVPLRLSSRPEAEGRSGETPAFREASAAGTSKSTEGAGAFSPVNTDPKQEGALAPGPRPPTPHERDLFASDVLRYFLLREIPFGQDGSFSFEALITRYNADLANGYGNLVSRTLKMITQYLHSSIPSSPPRQAEPWPYIKLYLPLADIQQGQSEFAASLTNVMNLTSVTEQIVRLVAGTDQEISVAAPWKLAKEPSNSNEERLNAVLYGAAESIRIITALLYPILPYATARVWAQLGLGDIEQAAKNGELKNLQWGGLKPGTKLGPLAPIFPRADKGLAQIMTDIENTYNVQRTTNNEPRPEAPLKQASTPTPAAPVSTDPTHPAAPPTALDEPSGTLPVGGSTAHTTGPDVTPSHTEAPASGIFAQQPSGPSALDPEPSSQITIDDFAKVELRIAEIKVCERIPKADKLLRLEVDLGHETRQILSGIAEHYTPEDLIGRRIIVITNLAPRKMRGLDSHGMLLAASGPEVDGRPGKPILATVPEGAPLGTRLK